MPIENDQGVIAAVLASLGGGGGIWRIITRQNRIESKQQVHDQRIRGLESRAAKSETKLDETHDTVIRMEGKLDNVLSEVRRRNES